MKIVLPALLLLSLITGKCLGADPSKGGGPRYQASMKVEFGSKRVVVFRDEQQVIVIQPPKD